MRRGRTGRCDHLQLAGATREDHIEPVAIFRGDSPDRLQGRPLQRLLRDIAGIDQVHVVGVWPLGWERPSPPAEVR